MREDPGSDVLKVVADDQDVFGSCILDQSSLPSCSKAGGGDERSVRCAKITWTSYDSILLRRRYAERETHLPPRRTEQAILTKTARFTKVSRRFKTSRQSAMRVFSKRRPLRRPEQCDDATETPRKAPEKKRCG